MEKIYIFDTTLRDGEQSPGASMTVEQKLEAAKLLSYIGVDVIEAGFPISSPKQFDGVRRIAETVSGSTIAGLARAMENDIKKCFDALKPAKKRRIHTFIATSDIHMTYKLKKTKDEVLKLAVNAVQYAKSLNDEVEFSAEDATRSDRGFLRDVYTAVIEAGATIINVPDTVGYTIPEEFARLIGYLRKEVKGIEKAIISVHCHNDLGLATANTLEALKTGARQAEVSVNGIGERAGNASFEEVVMSLKTRHDCYGLETTIKTEQIFHLSKTISSFTGMHVQPNKAIVGDNAFAHEAGIHQDGVIKHQMTYEIMTPQSIGRQRSALVLGRHSGKTGLKARLSELGYVLNGKDFDKLYAKFIEVADKKKEVFDDDLVALIEEELSILPETFSLVYFSVITGNNVIPTATVKLKKKKAIMQEASTGDGPVDAVYKAIERLTETPVKLINYSINAVTHGKDAMGGVTITVEKNNKIYRGYGVATDVIEASVLAFINAINRIHYNSVAESH
jgi:2-isopropylmalate synthase